MSEWVIVVDDDDVSQGITCATLAAAGYESIGVCSMFGLRRLRQTDRPALVLCDVSPPRSDEEIVQAVSAIRSVAHDKWRLAIMGVQPVHELERLARASKTPAVARGEDPRVLLESVESLIAGEV